MFNLPAHDHLNLFQICYDSFCPSIRSKIIERTCDICGSYLSSKSLVKIHKKNLHGRAVRTQVSSRGRPVYIADYRNTEALCIVKDAAGFETAKWID